MKSEYINLLEVKNVKIGTHIYIVQTSYLVLLRIDGLNSTVSSSRLISFSLVSLFLIWKYNYLCFKKSFTLVFFKFFPGGGGGGGGECAFGGIPSF